MRSVVLGLLLVVRIAAADEDLAGDVLVWHDAPLFVEPAPRADHVTLGKIGGSRGGHPGLAVPLHVVGTSGDFVEVEPAAGTDCAFSSLSSSDVDGLKLFARRADLAPALTQPFKAEFPDGTSVALEAGFPVVPGPGGRLTFALDEDRATLRLPGAPVGHAYPPPPERSATGGDSGEWFVLAPRTTVQVNGTAIRLGAPSPPWSSDQLEKRGRSTLFTLETTCARLRVAAPTAAIAPAPDEPVRDHMRQHVRGMPRNQAILPKGTPLASRSGHPIGVAARDLLLDAPPKGDRACTTVVVELHEPWIRGAHAEETDEQKRTLTVCAPAERARSN